MEDLIIKKVCGFSVSSMHFSMMILPYINKELEKEKNIITILEENLDNNIKQVLSKITLNNETKEKILNINWKRVDIKKVNIERKIKSAEERNISFIIYGSEEYINSVNNIISKIINKNKKYLISKTIKILDCYRVNDFNENIREILNMHETIFNTSGEQKKEDIFKEYYLA